MRIVLCSGVLLLAACSDPEPLPVEPTASAITAAPAEAPAETDTELRDAIQAPIDRAKAVEQDTLDDAEAKRQEMEAAGG